MKLKFTPPQKNYDLGRLIVKGHFLLLFVLVFAGCVQEEDLPTLEQEVPIDINTVKEWFEKGELNSLRENLGNQMRFKVAPNVEALKKEIEWDKYLVHDTKSGRKAYEFSLKYEKSLVPKSVIEGQEEWSGENLYISERVLFFPEGEDDYRIGVFKFYASGNEVNLSEQDFLQQFNVKSQSSELSGLIEEYSWEEEFIKGYQIKNGEITHTRKRISKEERDFLNRANIQVCSGYLVEYCTMYSVVGTNPDGSNYSYFQSMGDCFEREEGVQCLYQEDESPWPDDGPLPVDGPGGGDGPPNSECTICCYDPISGLEVECEELEEEIIKDPSFEGTKADCVYEKLLDLSGGFKNAIKKFDGEFPVAHLRFIVDNNLQNTTNAITRDGGDFMIEILFNGNTLDDRTILGLARTFIHEVIHAEMYRKVKSVNGSISVTDFPGIYDYYRRHIKNWQHEQMASHYRISIASMLQEFDTGIPLSSQQSPDQFYLDMSWVGLQRTSAWDDLDDDEQTRILTNIINYSSNGNKTCY